MEQSYATTVLESAVPTDDGIAFFLGGERRLLPWCDVAFGFTGEVGEPEGVRTVVFDIVVEASGGARSIYRFDADPIDAAGVARRIEAGIGKERSSYSLRSLASDGIVRCSYPDLESYEEDAVEEIGARL